MKTRAQASTTNPLTLVALSVIAFNSLLASSMTHAAPLALDTIIVTGEKIDRSYQETVTAITVVPEDDLTSSSDNQVKDLATKVPNVITDSFGHIAIRGVSGGGAATGGVALMTGARARVATVVDNSPQDWSGYNFAPVNLWDVKQVEVLRGPQSTTQGATAIAGALVVNTNDPTFEQEAAIRAGLESYENGNIKHNLAVMSSGALIDEELAYRIALDQTKGEGWLNYDTSGYSDDLPNLSESESRNIRGKLLWQPSAVPELSAKLTVNRITNTGEHANFASNTETGIATRTMTIADASGALSRHQDSSENRIAADIDYRIADGITNALHLSHIDSDIYADGYGYASGTTSHTYDIQQTTKSVENRLVFSQPNAQFSGVLGLFASRKSSVIDATQGVINIDTDYETTTTAAYGEGTYALSDTLALTSGLRIEKEKTDKTGSFFSTTEVDQNTDQTYYLPKIALAHKVTDTTTLGASIRKGYSPSGTYINTSGDVFSFDSEEVTAYELSSKSDFGLGTTLSANLFYNDYTDYQALSGFTIVNVEEAYTYGLELEASTWANDTLELHGSVGLLRSEIERYEAATTSQGNDLSSAPESNLRLGFTQLIGDAWSFGADITYVGEYYSDLSNSADNKVGNYTVTDANVQYTNGALTINGYVKNLTDEESTYYRADSLAAVGQSRTIGLNATYRM